MGQTAWKHPASIEGFIRVAYLVALLIYVLIGIALKAVRKASRAVDVAAVIEGMDPRLGEIYSELYERAIDFGGQPNERAVTGSMKVEESKDEKKYLQVYLHGDDIALRHSLKSTAQAGLCSLHIFQHMFTELYLLLGVRDRLIDLLQRNI
jgi:hypothetical protein